MKRYLDLPPLDESTIKNLYGQQIPEGYIDFGARYNNRHDDAMEQGPWHITQHPNRLGAPAEDIDQIDQPLNERLQYFWQHNGLVLDDKGHPIYPYADQFIADESLGMMTGLGWYWRYGPNQKTYAVLARQCDEQADLEVAVVRRPREDRLNLPGIFLKRSQLAITAALQVISKDIGLDTDRIKGTAIGSWPRLVPSPYDTLNAWREESIVAIREPNHAYLYAQQLTATSQVPDWRTVGELQEATKQGHFPARFLNYIDEAARLMAFKDYAEE